MKQVVQNYRTGELKVEDLPPPALRPGGVLVRTARSLISAGTERTIVETAQSSLLGKARERPDLVRQVIDSFRREGLRATYEKVRAKLDRVMPLGYSAAGVVIAVGHDVRDFRAGDRVACAGGGYATHAEVIFVPQNLCCKLPEGASFEAASYTTVGAIALQGVRQADARLGETAAVIGLGLIGQLTVQLLKAAGCRVLGIDIDKSACELGLKSGADEVASNDDEAAAACARMTGGRGADCVIITASTKSSGPVELAGHLARERAHVVVVGLVGMDVPRHTYYNKELDLRLSRSYGPGRYDPEYEEKGHDYPIGYVRWTERRNMEAFVNLVAEGRINTDLLTTHRFKVERAEQAYDLILGKKGGRYCGVVLEYAEGGTAEAGAVRAHRARPAAGDALGVGFIGAGNFARGVLLPIVRRAAKVKLTGLATATGVSASNTAGQFGFAWSTTDYAKILDDEQTQVVFIATRHDAHAALAAEALRRGKAVFDEKPLATTEDGLRDVVAAARDSGGLLMVGFNRRFAPLAREIKARSANRSGPMTLVYRTNAGQLPADHWSLDPVEGGGRIIGEACHFVDFVQYLTDALPARVSAAAVPHVTAAGYVDDSTVFSMTMTDGSVASIIYTASGNSGAAKEWVEIFCDRQIARLDDFKGGEFIAGGKKAKLGGPRDKGHAAEIAAFFEAARGRSDAPIGLDSLVGTTLACLAVVDSAKNDAGVAVDVGAFLSQWSESV